MLRWRLDAPWVAAHHFTLLALVRCEVQAIDQHWSLHRLAISLPDGQLDDGLAAELDFTQACTGDPASVTWPVPDPAEWESFLRAGLEQELFGDLAAIRARQENYLRREVQRIDTYFETYEVELTQRALRSGSGQTKLKVTERLAAARTEHSRRLQDQVHRHGIRVIPHLDTLLLLAEPAWKTTVSFVEQSRPRVAPALFVPHARRWIVETPQGAGEA